MNGSSYPHAPFDLLSSSLLGRSAKRRLRSTVDPVRDDDSGRNDEPVPSTATSLAIRDYFAAWRADDQSEPSRALRRVVDAWRGDTAASGVPAFAHLPLPGEFARNVSDLTGAIGEARTASFEKSLGDLDSSWRPLVAAQLAAHSRSTRKFGERSLLPTDDDVANGTSVGMPGGLADVNAALWPPRDGREDGERRLRTLEYVPERDGRDGHRNLPWDGRKGRAVELDYADPYGGSAVATIPGSGVPPAGEGPIGSSSPSTFKPDLGRPAPTLLPTPVSSGPKGNRRAYQAGNSRIDIPVGEDERDIIAGLNYFNNLRKPDGTPLVSGTFVNDTTGEGLYVIDGSGRVQHYVTWEYLRSVGLLGRSKKGQAETGARFAWRRPTEAANLERDWFKAQSKYKFGDGADAVIDPEVWGVQEDADEFADNAQRAANGEAGYKTNLRDAIRRAQETGEPQAVDLVLPASGPLHGARGLVVGLYTIRVRGVVVVKDGRYSIVGRATVVDTGKFNYNQDGEDYRSTFGKVALGLTRVLPDPVEFLGRVGGPGTEYSIRANRDADVEIWGVVR